MDTKTRATLHETLTGLGLDERRIKQYLSPLTHAICDLVGLETCLAIIENLGGRQVYLNKRATERSVLLRVAGEEKARKIVEFFGGDRHLVIANPFSSRTLLRLEGMKMLEDGQSYSNVAAALRVSRNTVRGWLDKLPTPRPPQEKPRDLAFRLFAAGRSLGEVHEALGVSPGTARRWQLQWENSL